VDSSDDTGDTKSPLLSQPSPSDFYYGSCSRASLLKLFDKEVKQTSTPTDKTTTKSHELKTAPTPPCTSSNATASKVAKAPKNKNDIDTPNREDDITLSQEQAIAAHLKLLEEKQAAEKKE
jgi:hypothetical protein